MRKTSHRPAQFAIKARRSSSGLGLYAAESIPKGRFITEYWGKIVNDEKAQEVGGRYLFEIGNGKTILGADRRNKARYANHSCRPNAETRQSGNHVLIYSRRPIQTGEEITYDYGRQYFNALIKPFGCRCAKCGN